MKAEIIRDDASFKTVFQINRVTAAVPSDQSERVLLEGLKYSLMHFRVRTTSRTHGHGVPIEDTAIQSITRLFFLPYFYKVTPELIILGFDPRSAHTFLSNHKGVFLFFLN